NDSYASILKALEHAGTYNDAKVKVRYIETTEIESGKTSAEEQLKGIHGLIIPGGFGKRGTEGKIACINHARENNIPFLGLCLGFQMAVIEFARNICGLKDANSTEIDSNTPNPVIDILPEQKDIDSLGGNMRLGAYPAKLTKGTKVYGLYGAEDVSERHRHRYEVNPGFIKILESYDLVFSGASPDRRLMEFLELNNHPYFVATQAHPEFKSRPMKPAPLFDGLVKVALKNQ
ncbi:gamma-glutamyl-gamma-aminobutyrate hydrolase family protein, partial [Candidatus Woesearchaeota archaeon]|nr:gamma-glutamyl-gamma-aminobutyrate hydrolase family protein [Candidatus Woesearchaeota archaeon]